MAHTCNNFLMTCIDFRFHSAITDWAEKQGITKDFDLVAIAGVQKAILDDDTRNAAIKQLHISVRLHKTRTAILIAHQDCGAYGGSSAFANWDEEKAKYTEDLNEAEKVIKEKFPELQVKKMILTFDENEKVEIIEV
ncbi:hypothetical protein HQ571_01260 [Candidatus Kuenenbacteria bacterium]|nr:hypothetical protein [Candidatus Kuenenbacteria bacterium]